MSILASFPYPNPRSEQVEVLQSIEKQIDSADVFVIKVPTAGGKTGLAMTIMRWLLKSENLKTCYAVPNNILLQQFEDAFPKMHLMKNMDSYECILYKGDSCRDIRGKKDCMKCKDCPYMKAKRKSYAMPYIASNIHSLLANKLFKNALIYDEAHLLISLIQERAAKKLWLDDYGIPTNINSYGRLLSWAESKERLWKDDKKFQLLLSELRESRHKLLVKKGFEDYRGEPRMCLKLLPINTEEYAGFLWGKAEKIFLMSATINEKDIHALGLSGRRVAYFEVKSPIEPWRRAIFPLNALDLSFRNQDNGMHKLADTIEKLLEAEPGKGFIHAPYSLVEKLRVCKGGIFNEHPRLLFHDKEDKMEVFQAWKESDPSLGMTMVASGMYEGVSLDYDLARWQCITKIPYPSLAEPAIRFKMENDEGWYSWETAKTVIQACGRVCRTPEDEGYTYILDSSWKRFYSQSWEQLPDFFKDAVFEGESPCE